VDIPATSDNIPGTLVLRDASGSLSAGTLNTTNNTNSFYAIKPGSPPLRINHTDGSGRATISWNVDGASHNIGTAKYFAVDPALRIRIHTTGFEFYTAPVGVAGDLIAAWTVGLCNTITGQVAVGTVTPDAAAALEVNSTTRGFLPPRMTTTQRDAITSPPAGLMIYNTTTNKLNVRTASSWEAVTSA